MAVTYSKSNLHSDPTAWAKHAMRGNRAKGELTRYGEKVLATMEKKTKREAKSKALHSRMMAPVDAPNGKDIKR